MRSLKYKEYKLLIFYVLALSFIVIIVDSGITASFRYWLRINIPNLDKVGHFLGMGLLVFLMLKSFIYSDDRRFVRKVILIIGLLFLLATAEEFSQKLLRYRSFELWDLAANYMGILMFAMAFLLLKIRKMNADLVYNSHNKSLPNLLKQPS